MTKETAAIIKHYSVDDLVDRILRALAAAGHDTSHPTVDMLNLADQMHGGGLNATKTQAELAGIAAGMRVLDAGCGVGGSSRYLAHAYGCRVDAVDLTPLFVATAERLNALCGISDMIAVREASVTALPFEELGLTQRGFRTDLGDTPQGVRGREWMSKVPYVAVAVGGLAVGLHYLNHRRGEVQAEERKED